MTKELPSPELLRKLLRYEPRTGKLFWRERDEGMFSDSVHSAKSVCIRWNKRFSGNRAFATVGGHGYLQGRVLWGIYKAHRVAWAIYYGEWPIGEIDHINGSRVDNRIANLRDVTASENSKNKRPQKKRKGKIVGVYWRNRDNIWRAQIKVGGKAIHLGSFGCFLMAVRARKAAEIKYGFHKNHGK